MAGSITRRAKDRYTITVDYPPAPSNPHKRRQIRRSVKGSMRDAEALLARLVHERNTGFDPPVEGMTLADFMTKHYLPFVKGNREARTYQTVSDITTKHLIPMLGSIKLAKLRPIDIQAYYDAKLVNGRLDGRGPLSGSSVHRHYEVLHAALQHAVDLDLLPRNPADRAKPPRKERKEFRALSPAEAETLFTAADGTPYGALVRVVVWTGLRMGEVLGLRWSDVDLAAGILSVRQTVQSVPGNGLLIKPPKTHRSRRAVDLSPLTVAVLKEQRQRQLEERLRAGPAYQDRDLVFPTALGTPTDPANLKRAWRSTVRRAGIGHVRFQDLRHTHASLLLTSGEHLKVVSERLGHASVAITGDLYSHVAPGLQRAAAERLDRLFAADA